MTTEADHQNSSLGTNTALISKSLPEGTVLAGRFRILSRLGVGGQAHVYRARDEVLGSDIALKLIAPQHALDLDQVQRLRQEVLLSRELNHPNIVRVFEFYQDGDWAFFTMGLIEGRNLAEYIHQGITRAQADLWSRQLLQALEACHTIEITHADVKPENIIIDERGHLVLLDFGIGQLGEQLHTDYSGSHGYKAPEVTQLGKRDRYSDSYSSGRLIADLINATRIKRWQISDQLWRKNRLSLAKTLSKPFSHQRISVQEAQRRLDDNFQRNLGLTVMIMTVTVVIGGLFVWMQPKVSVEPVDPTSDQIRRIAVTYMPNDPLLAGVAELLHLHLITQPGVDVVEQNRVESLIDNLGLRPFRQQEHRARLGMMLNADILIMLQRHEMEDQDNFRLQMLMAEMPGNRLFGAFQGVIGDQGLSQVVEQVFLHVNNQLLLSTRELFVSAEELQRIEPVLAAMRQGRLAEAEGFIQTLQTEWPEFPGGWLAGAQLAAEQGDLALAREQLQFLFELVQDDGYWHLEGRALQAEIDGDVQTAVIMVDRLLEMFPGRTGLLDRRAELAAWQDDLDTAIKLYQRALEIDPSSGDRWFELARLRIINGQIQQAIDNELMQALIRYRQQEDFRGQGTALNAFGVASIRLAESERAIQYFQEALQLRTMTTDPYGRAVTLGNLASVYAILARYEEAETALSEASEIFQINNDRSGLAQIENEWGVLLEEQGRYREALVHYRHALDLRIQLGSTLQQAESINNVAYMHFLMGDFSQADIFWNQALSLFQRGGDQTWILRTKLNLVQLSLSRGEYGNATSLLSEVLPQVEDKRPAEELITQFLLSHRNFNLGNLRTAQANSLAAEKLANNLGDVRAQIEVAIWSTEMCLYLANVPCMEREIASLSALQDSLNAEQVTVFEWLFLTKQILREENTASEVAAFWSRFRKQLLPVQTELRILLSLLELQFLPADSWQWQRVDELVRPVMYKEFMQSQYLKALHFGSASARDQLGRLVQN